LGGWDRNQYRFSVRAENNVQTEIFAVVEMNFGGGEVQNDLVLAESLHTGRAEPEVKVVVQVA
jgi:hypothetical protein